MPTGRKSNPQHSRAQQAPLVNSRTDVRAWPLPSPTSGQTLLTSVLGADDSYWHGGVQLERGSPCTAGLAKLAKPCSPPLRSKALFGRRLLGQEGKLRCAAPHIHCYFLLLCSEG